MRGRLYHCFAMLASIRGENYFEDILDLMDQNIKEKVSVDSVQDGSCTMNGDQLSRSLMVIKVLFFSILGFSQFDTVEHFVPILKKYTHCIMYFVYARCNFCCSLNINNIYLYHLIPSLTYSTLLYKNWTCVDFWWLWLGSKSGEVTALWTSIK